MSKKVNLNPRSKKVIVFAVIIVLSIAFSFLASSAKLHSSVIEVLDEKKTNALELSISASAIATGISILPEDVGVSVANQISEISSYVLLIVCVIYLEKFLLTTAGFITFAFLIPISCLLYIIYLYKDKQILKTLAVKLSIFGLVIFLVVPTSVLISNMIESTHQQSIENSMNEAKSISEEIEENSGLWDKIKGGSAAILDKVETKLSNFIDAIAVMIITTCAIPILVLMFMLWIIKMLFGINIKIQKPKAKKFMPKNDNMLEGGD